MSRHSVILFVHLIKLCLLLSSNGLFLPFLLKRIKFLFKFIYNFEKFKNFRSVLLVACCHVFHFFKFIFIDSHDVLGLIKLLKNIHAISFEKIVDKSLVLAHPSCSFLNRYFLNIFKPRIIDRCSILCKCFADSSSADASPDSIRSLQNNKIDIILGQDKGTVNPRYASPDYDIFVIFAIHELFYLLQKLSYIKCIKNLIAA